MKIHIVGGSGSGKSYLAERLSRELGIPHYDLDDLFWDNDSGGYDIRREPAERDALLAELLSKPEWIIEGVYCDWCRESFAAADKIYLLNVPRYKYRFRIIRRFLRRKLGVERGKNESLKSLINLLKWADRYQRVNLPEIQRVLEPYKDKVIED